MSSLTTAWSPGSFQLRLAFRCERLPPAIIVRTRLKKLDHQIRVCCVARSGDGVEHRPGVHSVSGSRSPADPFSGWSSSNGGTTGPSRYYRRTQWLTEIVGATVAGVVLFAGLTFAAMSLGKRSTSRPKQQMEPLTTQVEASLSSESQSNSIQDNGTESGKAGRDKVNVSSQVTKSSFENIIDKAEKEIPSVEFISNAPPVQEDLQSGTDFVDMSVSPETSFGSPELPEPEVVHDSFSFKDLDDNVALGMPDKNTELEVDLVDMSDVTLPHEVETGSEGGGTHGIFLDSSSNSIAHMPVEPVVVSVSVNSGLDAALEPDILSRDDIETSDLDLEKTLEALPEKNSIKADVHSVNERGQSEATAVAASEDPLTNGEAEINRSRKLYDLPTAWNSSSPGIPAPSVLSAALQVLPGKVLVPAFVDQVQGQALAALQVLKVIEGDVQPSDLCTRREYARWLVSASSALSRTAVSKVYPAMYIDNVTELAFDDVTPQDPDFSSIQGLAEAGLISSKLSRRDMFFSLNEDLGSCFSPDSPLSRQDLVSWKIAVENKHLPDADRKILHQLSGYIDIDKINPDAWPAIMADLSTGDQGIIAHAFGYTKLFQPDKPVTKAQAAIALATGEASDTVSEELARIEAEFIAENAVAAHNALVTEVEKDINASFEKELLKEREKTSVVEKMAEEARLELERLKAQRDLENIALMKEHAAVESEMEVLSRFRSEVEQQLQGLTNNKVEISYERERISQLRKEVEYEKQEIARLHYELEVERKALSMARSWAEDEAKRAREQAKSLEVARDRWERHGIKVIVDSDLQEEASTGVTWLNAGKQLSVEGTVSRAENLVDTLKVMAADLKGKSKETIEMVIQRISFFVTSLREWACSACIHTEELREAVLSKVSGSGKELEQVVSEFSLALREGVKRVAGECREGVEKLTQKFKTA